MDFLHNLSSPATKSELELFTVPPTNTAIAETYDVEYHATSSIDSSSLFEFNCPASDDFTDLSSTFLQVELTVKKDDTTDLGTTSKLTTAENFGNALFESFDIILSGTNITQSNDLYGYRSYFDLKFGRYPNKCLDTNFTNVSKSIDKDNCKLGLYFRLHGDIMQQKNLLINGIPMIFRLVRAKDTFSIFRESTDSTTTEVKMKINKLSLFVKRVRLYPDALQAIELALQKAPARYFVNRVGIKSFTIPSSVNSFKIDGVYNGQLPRRLIIGFVSADAKSGKISANPFQFAPFAINYICINVNGVQIPSQAYTPDFTNSLYEREFYNLYHMLGQDDGLPMTQISYIDYATKDCFFAFSLSPDNSTGGESGTLDLLRRGSLRVEMKFKNNLSASIHMICYAVFDSVILIDQYRNVSLDY